MKPVDYVLAPVGTVDHWRGRTGHWFLVNRQDTLYLTLKSDGLHYIQSAIRVGSPQEPVLPYIAHLSTLNASRVSRTSLVAGVGLGSLVLSLLKSGHAAIDAVDLDLTPIRRAASYLPVFDSRVTFFERDINEFLGLRSKDLYDQVFLDLYGPTGWPCQACSPSFFAALRQQVHLEGSVYINCSERGANTERMKKASATYFVAVNEVVVCGNSLLTLAPDVRTLKTPGPQQ
jgi:hypothetical protein